METLFKSLLLLAIIVQLFVQCIASKKDPRQILETPVFDHCPNGSIRHDNSCYFFSHLLANWPEAYVYCQSYAAHLAFIETEDEQSFIATQVLQLVGSQTDDSHYYWLGGTDAVSEGEWYWSTIVQPVEYTNWREGEPNNDVSHESHSQDCMSMYSENGLWDDGWCETKHNFICEIELDVESGIIG